MQIDQVMFVKLGMIIRALQRREPEKFSEDHFPQLEEAIISALASTANEMDTTADEMDTTADEMDTTADGILLNQLQKLHLACESPQHKLSFYVTLVQLLTNLYPHTHLEICLEEFSYLEGMEKIRALAVHYFNTKPGLARFVIAFRINLEKEALLLTAYPTSKDNIFLKDQAPAPADLSYLDLSYLDFSNEESYPFHAHNFTASLLEGVNFTGLDLDGAFFIESNLTHANLSDVKGQNIAFVDAVLKNTLVQGKVEGLFNEETSQEKKLVRTTEEYFANWYQSYQKLHVKNLRRKDSKSLNAEEYEFYIPPIIKEVFDNQYGSYQKADLEALLEYAKTGNKSFLDSIDQESDFIKFFLNFQITKSNERQKHFWIRSAIIDELAFKQAHNELPIIRDSIWFINVQKILASFLKEEISFVQNKTSPFSATMLVQTEEDKITTKDWCHSGFTSLFKFHLGFVNQAMKTQLDNFAGQIFNDDVNSFSNIAYFVATGMQRNLAISTNRLIEEFIKKTQKENLTINEKEIKLWLRSALLDRLVIAEKKSSDLTYTKEWFIEVQTKLAEKIVEASNESCADKLCKQQTVTVRLIYNLIQNNFPTRFQHGKKPYGIGRILMIFNKSQSNKELLLALKNEALANVSLSPFKLFYKSAIRGRHPFTEALYGIVAKIDTNNLNALKATEQAIINLSKECSSTFGTNIPRANRTDRVQAMASN